MKLKKTFAKKKSVSSCSHLNAVIFSTITNEHWENIGSITLIDLLSSVFFFFINAYVKIQRMTSPFMQRIYRFHTLMRAFFDSFPAYAFSFLPCCVFSHCSFRCNNEYIIWSKGIRLKYLSNKIDTRVPFVGRPRKCQLEKRGNAFFEKGGQTKIVLTKRQCTLVRLADKSCNVPLSITRRDAFSLYTGSRRGRL